MRKVVENLNNRVKSARYKLAPPLIGSRAHGDVYRISEDKIVKVFRNSRRLLQNESRVGNILYAEGVSVPKHYGVMNVRLRGKMVEGLVREYIGGIELGNILDEVNEEEAREKLFEERRKAMKLGFQPGVDSLNPGNSIWVPEERKIVLIDFALWEGGPGEVFLR